MLIDVCKNFIPPPTIAVRVNDRVALLMDLPGQHEKPAVELRSQAVRPSPRRHWYSRGEVLRRGG